MGKGKLKAVRFNKTDQEKIEEIADLTNFLNCYGEIPSVLRISISLFKENIVYLEKVIPSLKLSEMETLLSSVLNYRNPEKRHIVKIIIQKR